MLVQNEFLKKIKDFGLNTYEAKIWTALLSRGVSTAGELSDIANVPRSRSYDVLESLEKKGFIIMKIGKPIKYLAVPPEEVLERVKKKIQDDTTSQLSSLNKLKESDLLTELNTLHTEGVSLVDPAEITASLKGRDRLYSHLDMMIKSAEKSVLLVTSEEGALRKLSLLSKSFEKANKRGVSIKIATALTSKTKDLLKNMEKFAKVIDYTGKGRFCIIDDKQVMFMLMDDNTVHPNYDVGIWANTEFFSETLSSLFGLATKNLNLKN